MTTDVDRRLRALRREIADAEAKVLGLIKASAPGMDVRRAQQRAADLRMQADGLVLLAEIAAERRALARGAARSPDAVRPRL